MRKMKKRVLVEAAALCLCFIVFQISGSSTSRFNLPFSAETRGKQIQSLGDFLWKDRSFATIKDLTLTVGPSSPSCTVLHSAPALVFTAGGYTRKLLARLNDGFIPPLITANTIFPDQDLVIVVSEARNWWLRSMFVQRLGWTGPPMLVLGAWQRGCTWSNLSTRLEWKSSLADKYGNGSVSKGSMCTEVMDIYSKEQNVKLDLVRFKGYLKKNL
ncbi:hypothetical protein M0R45_022189 [Rubus argutus]|uniref:Uncharacterized protein n=1 Tax=Rubus argutus TaxID=59490 RepID=A0AAW1XEW7_RUBAR